MSAVELRFRGQCRELVHRTEHLRHRALKYTATAQREQRVTGENGVFGGHVVGDVAERVAGAVQNPHLAPFPGETVAAGDQPVDPGNLQCLGARSSDAAAISLPQREVSLNVVAMMMGGEDMRQFPALGTELALDFGCIRRVDGAGGPGLEVMQQKAVIVGSAVELVEGEVGHGSFRCCRA